MRGQERRNKKGLITDGQSELRRFHRPWAVRDQVWENRIPQVLPTLGRDLNLIRLTTKALAELADADCLGEAPYVEDDAAIAAYADVECTIPVGFVAYYVRTTRNMAWLHLGYVVPDWRSEGVYRQLWQALIDKCVKENYTSIGGGNIHKQPSHASNHGKIWTARRQSDV